MISVATDVHGYRVLRLLHLGGRSQLWLVQREDTLFTLEYFSSLDAVTLQQLHRTFASLQREPIHPCFARVLEVGDFLGRLYVVREHIEGEPLPQWISRQPSRVGSSSRLMLQLLRALHSLHHAAPPTPSTDAPYREVDVFRLSHQRLVLDNLVVTGNGRLRCYHEGLFSKQALYPEPYPSDLPPTDGVSLDLYQVGALFFELLTQRKFSTTQPFTGFPRELELILRRATSLEINPTQRYKNAAEMMIELIKLLNVIDPTIATLMLDEALDWLERQGSMRLQCAAQLLEARPDLCTSSFFTQKLWELFYQEIAADFGTRKNLSPFEWVLWTRLPQAKEYLIGALQVNPSMLAQLLAARLLGYHSGVTEALTAALHNLSPEVRVEAAIALSMQEKTIAVTHGKNAPRIVPCSQPWDGMTPGADPSVRTCQRCEAPVVKVSTIKDLAKITGNGCALYAPNVSSWRARRALRRLYTIPVGRPLRPPDSTLPSAEERPAQRPSNSLFIGLIDVGDFEDSGRSQQKPSLWERCKAFFSL